MTYEDTSIWRQLSEATADTHSGDRLASAYRSLESVASTLADEIRVSMPQLTEHGAPHLDAVWQMADLIAGGGYAFSPAEVFVFGGSVLLHDLGLGVAAYPGGVEELQSGVEWDAALSVVLRQRTGSLPSRSDLDAAGDAVRAEALELLLRTRHARQARDLGIISWTLRGEQRFLIDDPDLRETYGRLIGQVAASHWTDVANLAETLPEAFGAMAGFPADWTVRPLVLAALLRTADAAHLDARRAPSWTLTFRKPTGVSLDHWNFQSKLNVPLVQSDRLLYTSGSDFGKSEAQSWWLCYAAICVADDELRETDELLRDEGLPRFAINGVVDARPPEKLSRHVRVRGWDPVDIAVSISDPINLIERFGGTSLYGRETQVPLRELIQNAADAVRARRTMEHRESSWGQILVTIETDQAGFYLEIRDDGKGMSRRVLTRTLLDFGSSLWSSSDLINEAPELLGTGFEPAGRFGIGFFSVFMWAPHVVVTTRRPRDSMDQTLVLEITDGLYSRPLVRVAEQSERLIDPGTRVRLYISADLEVREHSSGTVRIGDIGAASLAELCAWLCPTLDVDLAVKCRGDVATAIVASDWKTCTDSGLLDRIGRGRNLRLSEMRNADGALVGRAAIATYMESGVITVGGLRSSTFRHTVGVILGRDPNLARDSATPAADRAAFDAWLGEQLELQAEVLDARWGATALAYGFEVGEVPVCDGDSGPLSIHEIARMAGDHEDILVVTPGAISAALQREDLREDLDYDIYDGVVLLPDGMISFRGAGFEPVAEPDVEGVILEAIANGWNTERASLIVAEKRAEFGTTFTGHELSGPVQVVSRPV